ncbi:MAG: hypothetical protein GXO10_01080 [Crenarchaeota archaeon]|nr:hypothetical protein [Thermoproteota archaeon]
MRSRVIVKVSIKLDRVDECEAVRKAIQVDNVDLPNCIRDIVVKCEESILKIDIICRIDESLNILTAWSTIDDIIRCVRAAIEALREAEKKRI